MSRESLKNNFTKEGTILIVSLWIMAILTVLSVGLGHRMGLELKLAGYHRDGLKALHLAKAGIRRATLELERDTASLYTSKYDTLYECGIKELEDEEDLEKIFKGEFEDGEFVVGYEAGSGRSLLGMMDEERRVNINKAPQELLEALLEVNGITEDTEEIARSIRLWRGDLKGVDPVLLLDEDQYYQVLELPYVRKGAAFEAIEELLLVRGMDQSRLSEIKETATIFGEGKVNINTAGEKVLRALGLTALRQISGARDERWVEGLVEDIIDGRDGFDDKAGTDDDESFTDISQAKAWVKDTKAKELLELMAAKGLITFRSHNFRIRAVGEVNKVAKIATAIVSRDPATGKVIELVYWREE